MTVAARLRILIKSADYLERTSDVDTLIVDKTGTVTVGVPSVVAIRPHGDASAEQTLAIAAACGFGSLHPVSRAMVGAANARELPVVEPRDLQERPGLGVMATVDGAAALLGRRALLEESGVATPPAGADSASEVWVAYRGRCLGHIVLLDQPRADARAAIDAIRALGISRVVLLTGDRAATTHAVGEALAVDHVVAEVLPEQKLEVIRAEQATGRTVMMVGDGVNDAPALGGADVGVAIGAELNEVAVGGADVAVIGNDLRRLPQLVRLADLTREVTDQNVWLAFGLSLILIASAATGVVSPLTGALAQSAAVLVVVANGARILRFGATA
jgi:P-type E1-E2 ATPase